MNNTFILIAITGSIRIVIRVVFRIMFRIVIRIVVRVLIKTDIPLFLQKYRLCRGMSLTAFFHQQKAACRITG